MSESSSTDVVEVQLSFLQVVFSAFPILVSSILAYTMSLSVTSMFMIGTVRTLVQLTLVGWILSSIFMLGEKHPLVVLLYVLFMVIVASYEAASRQKYSFAGMSLYIFGTICFSLLSISIFGFTAILHPVPIWDPRYVIPICGMLLGNAVSAVGLSLNTLVTDMMEKREELDLMLSFGANKWEAVLPFVRTAVATGLTPTLNSMAVIGIISLPGMMTGQILGGTPPEQATRYQVMIMYFIASCSFIVVLLAVFLTTQVAFDQSDTFRKDRFTKSSLQKRSDPLVSLFNFIKRTISNCFGSCLRPSGYTEIGKGETGETMPHAISNKRFTVLKTGEPLSNDKVLLIEGAKRVLVNQDTNEKYVLFDNVNACLYKGDIALLKGESGSGKTQFLRLIAGLDPLAKGDLYLNGEARSRTNMPRWRQRVRYVTQTRVTISGTPSDFMKRVVGFKANRQVLDLSRMHLQTRKILKEWGMKEEKLDQDWKDLSGGEAQRVIVAISLSTEPACLLLDEPDSALDHKTKLALERVVKQIVSSLGIAALWITHDEEQFRRLEK